MANSTIRSVAGNGASGSTPFNPGVNGKRAMHRLSDGTLIAVIFDTNRNDIAGDGGDGTNIGKIYIYSSPDGVTWTLRATQTTDLVGTNASNQGIFSSCVGPDNAVHIAYISNAFNAMYIIATYAAGNIYTLGTLRTLYTVASSKNATRIDVDTLGNSGQLAIVSVYTEGATSMDAKIYFALSGGTTITNPTSISISTTSIGKANFQDIVICGCKDAIASNTGTWVMVVTRVPNTGADLQDLIYTGQVNTSTGVVIGATNSYVTAAATSTGGTAAQRRWMLTCTGARDFIATRMTASYPSFNAMVTKFTLSAVGVKTDLIAPSSATTTSQHSGQLFFTWAADTNSGNAWATSIYSPGASSQKVLFLFNLGSGSTPAVVVDNIVADLTGGSINWRIQAQGWTTSFSAATASLTSVIAGNQRNLSSSALDALVTYGRAGYVSRYHGLDAMPAPGTVIPAASSTVSTDRPTLQANYKNTYSTVQLKENMQWDLATDSGFTTNHKTQLGTDSVTPQNTDSVSNAVVTATKVIDAPQELLQAVWYIKATQVDEFGNLGTGSTAQSFTVTHLPVPANLYPNGGTVFAYGTGQVQVNWDFTDPSPYDFQTAYRVVVEDATTGSSIYDSTKVTSAAKSAIVTIPSLNKDSLLRWKVYLWDSDDAAGPASSYQTFEVSDAPTPVITSPGSPFTSSIPNVVWTPGISGAKTQVAYRLQISLAGVSVYDSNWTNSTSTSTQLPPGYLHNANNYTFMVSVRDSLGLEGSYSVSLLSSWAPPAAADITRVYLYEYDRKGFIFIGWSSVNISANFKGWNLYRRAIGDVSWTLLYQTSDYRNNYGYRDFTAKSGTIYQYIVTQITNLAGDILESVFTNYTQVTTPSSRYWLLDSFGIVDAVPLYNATKDDFTDEYENAVYNIIGRGRHTDIGDHLGNNGQLTVQMFDRPTDANKSSINCYLDPSAQSHNIGNIPDYWTISGTGSFGNLSYDYQTMYEPAPNGKLINLFFRSDALGIGGTDAITLVQNITVDRLPAVPGNQFTNAMWFAKEPDPLNTANLSYTSVVQYYTAANALISTETVVMTQFDTYEPVTSGDVNTGSFKRYQALHSMPLTTDHMTVTTQVKTAVAGPAGVVFAGASLDGGTVPDAQFDGDMQGVSWTAAEYSSSSSTTGFYTAREQRTDISGLKALGRPLILRSPFGDFWQVNLGDIPFSREGGHGASDIGELIIPYYEVGF